MRSRKLSAFSSSSRRRGPSPASPLSCTLPRLPSTGLRELLKIFAVRRDAKTRGWHAHIRWQRHQKILALVAVGLVALVLLAFFAFLIFEVSGLDSDIPGRSLTIQKEAIVSALPAKGLRKHARTDSAELAFRWSMVNANRQHRHPGFFID